MAEPSNDRNARRYDETGDPENPPNSVTNRTVRSLALRSYLGPIVVLFIVVGIGLIYWANRPLVDDGDTPAAVGTTGEQPGDDVIGDRGGTDSPGGFDPTPRPGSTREEIERRSGGPDPPVFPGNVPDNELTNLHGMVGSMESRLLGRRITVSGARVERMVSPTLFWIEENNERAMVYVPEGGPELREGQTVTVSGVVEPDGERGVRIRASRVSVEE